MLTCQVGQCRKGDFLDLFNLSTCLQVAPVTEPGRMLPMPQLASQLNVGNGCLVRWSLLSAEQHGFGFVLMIEEIIDRAQKLKHAVSEYNDLAVVEHIVYTLAACTGLLARCDLFLAYAFNVPLF